MAISHKRDPADLPPVQPQATLHRPVHRRRGHECEDKRAALDQAAQGHRQAAAARNQAAPRATAGH